MSEPRTEADSMPTRITGGLKWLGEHRDGFLVGGAVIYGLGYLVWSYNAYRNHLGQLPGLEFQYLISGLVPALLLGAGWATASLLWKLRDWVPPFAVKDRIRFFRIALVGTAIVPLSIVTFLFFAFTLGWRVGLRGFFYTAPLWLFLPPLLSVVVFGPRPDLPTNKLRTYQKVGNRIADLLWRVGVPAFIVWFYLFTYLSL